MRFFIKMVFILSIQYSMTLAETTPHQFSVGNTGLAIDQYGNVLLQYKHQPIVEWNLSKIFSKSTKADAGKGFASHQKTRDNEIDWIVTFNGDHLDSKPRTITFTLKSHSIQIKYDLSGTDTTSLQNLQWSVYESACLGAQLLAEMADGTQKQGELERDPLFPDSPLLKLRQLTLSGPTVGQLVFESDAGQSFDFLDERQQDRNTPKRKLLVHPQENRLSGTLNITFEQSTSATFTPIDIRSACNRGFSDIAAKDGKGGWFDDGADNDLRAFPIKQRYFCGIPFRIVNPSSNRNRSVVVLSKAEQGTGGLKPETTFAINATGATLHVLHAAGRSFGGKETKDGRVFGACVVYYSDGSEEVHEIRYGRDIRDWWDMGGGFNFLPAWEHSNSRSHVAIGLSSFAISKPNVPIQKIRIEMRDSGPGLLGIIAMTLSDISLKVVSEKPYLGPPEMESLTYRYVGCGATIASWIDGKILNVTGLQATEGYDVAFGKDDVLMMGVNHTHKDRRSIAPTLAQAQKIIDFVRSGGGLYVAWPLDESLDSLRDILPVARPKDADPVIFVPKIQRLTCTAENKNHPIFSQIDWSTFPAQPYYFPCEPLKDAQVLIRFSNGSPAFVMGRFGKGRVIFSAIPLEYANYVANLGYRYQWPKWSFYLQVLYLLKGNDRYAEFIGQVPHAQAMREGLCDTVSACSIALQNVRALGVYLNQSTPVEKLEKNLASIMNRMDTTDRYLAALKLTEATEAYRKANTDGKVLLKQIEATHQDFISQVSQRKDLKLIQTQKGPPLQVGSHGMFLAYGNERACDSGVREQAIEKLMERQVRLGFNTSAEHRSLSCFIKPGAKPSTLDNKNLNLWVYDDLIRLSRKMGWQHFIAIDSSLSYDQDPSRNSFFNEGIPLRDPPSPDAKKGTAPVFPSIWNEEYRKRRHQVLEKVVAHFAQTPEVVGYDLDNEPKAFLGYSEDVIRTFQEWLKKKYDSIESLNNVLHTSYRAFNDVIPPQLDQVRQQGGPAVNRAVWYEWMVFQDDVNVSYYQTDYEIIKRISPDKKVRDRFSDITVTGRADRLFRNGRHPYYRITKHLDMTGLHTWDLYPLDFMRAQANGIELGMSEYYPIALDGPYDFRLQIHNGTGGPWSVPVMESESRNFTAGQRNFWVALSRGVRSFSLHSPGAGGLGVYHLLLPSNINWQRYMYALKYTKIEFERLRGDLDGAKSISQVALLEIPESIIQGFGSTIEEDIVCTEVEQKAIFNTLQEPLGIQSDPIAPDADLHAYPVLFVTQPIYLSTDNKNRLLDYVNQGGILVATGPIGLYDEHGFLQNQFLKELMGIGNITRMAAPAQIRIKTQIVAMKSGSKVWKYELHKNTPAKVLAHFENQVPAIMECRIGKGRLIMTAYAFSQTDNIASQLNLFVKALVFPAEVERPVALYHLKKDNAIILYAYNRSVEPVNRTMKFRNKCYIEDLRAGVGLNAQQISLKLDAGEVRIFRINKINDDQ